MDETVELQQVEELSLTEAIEATGYNTVSVFFPQEYEASDNKGKYVLSREKNVASDMTMLLPEEEYVLEEQKLGVVKEDTSSISRSEIGKAKCMEGHYFDRERFEVCPVCGSPEQGQTRPKAVHLSEESIKEVVGWLVCLNGKYKGRSFECKEGRNRIGSRLEYEISLTWMETMTVDVQAYLIYEPKRAVFYLENGNGNELVYLNDELLFSHSQINAYDKIQVGKVEFIFIPLCGEKFKWADYAD